MVEVVAALIWDGDKFDRPKRKLNLKERRENADIL
jgi:hypothetical protein